MEHILTGKKGEAKAFNFLKTKKYKIVETNFKCRLGEIDVIAKDKKTLVFIEVKTRTSHSFGLPREAVDETKQNKIRMVATMYLQIHGLFDVPVRFDVIEVDGDKIVHFKGCF